MFPCESRMSTEEYRDGYDRIWGNKTFDEVLEEVVGEMREEDIKFKRVNKDGRG